MNGQQECIDNEGHDYLFVGYMVIAEKLPEDEKVTTQVKGTSGTAIPYFSLPAYFPAKIEVWQCKKCGWVSLKPAVFSRL